MPSWTTCHTQYREYNLPDDEEGQLNQIRHLLKRFLPTMERTQENLDRVTWHFDHEACTASSLRPLSSLMSGGFTLGPDDKIHLHGPATDDSGESFWKTRKGRPGLDLGVDGGSGEGAEDDIEDWEEGNDSPDDEIMGGEGDDDESDEGEGDDDSGGDGDGDDCAEDNDNEIQESIDTDPETLKMRTDLDPRELYVRVVYDFDGAEENNKTKSRTKPEEVLHVSRQRTLSQLFTFLAVFVERKLKTAKMKRYLAIAQKTPVLVRPQLQHDCPVKRRAFTFDDTGIARIAVINDLLDDGTIFKSASIPTANNIGTERDYQPQLTVVLKYVDAVERNTGADPLVIIRSGAETLRTGGIAKFYRIGAEPGRKGTEKNDVAVSSSYFWRCESEGDPNGVKLVKAPTWSLRELIICNPDESNSMAQKSITIKQKVEQKDTAAPTRHNQFLTQLKKRSLHPYTEGRLLYNYGSWLRDVASSRKVKPIESTEFPKSGITIAVRYINHLQDDAVKEFIFGSGDEYVLDKDDGHEELCKHIKESLRRERPLDFFEGDWDIELWIMPQIPDGNSLYKFKSTSELVDWLHKPCVAKKDAVLFAEAHIIPVVSEEKVSSSGRVAKKARRA